MIKKQSRSSQKNRRQQRLEKCEQVWMPAIVSESFQVIQHIWGAVPRWGELITNTHLSVRETTQRRGRWLRPTPRKACVCPGMPLRLMDLCKFLLLAQFIYVLTESLCLLASGWFVFSYDQNANRWNQIGIMCQVSSMKLWNSMK